MRLQDYYNKPDIGYIEEDMTGSIYREFIKRGHSLATDNPPGRHFLLSPLQAEEMKEYETRIETYERRKATQKIGFIADPRLKQEISTAKQNILLLKASLLSAERYLVNLELKELEHA